MVHRQERDVPGEVWLLADFADGRPWSFDVDYR
jgi:hypothetical protein